MTKTLLAVAAVLGLGWAATRKPKKVAPRPTAPTPTPPTPQAPAPRPLPQFVGSGWTNWPHKDEFPDQRAFGQALQLLGYNSGGWNQAGYSLLQPTPKAAIIAFQNDYNWVKGAYNPKGDPACSMQADGPLCIGEDELMGPATIRALVAARFYMEDRGKSWYEIVDDAKQALSAPQA